jgi:hypothetical protein
MTDKDEWFTIREEKYKWIEDLKTNNVMTPKEKAKELVEKFYVPLPLKREVITKVKKIPFEYDDWEVANQCALIAVDELINNSMPSSEFGGYVQSYTIEYWEEVKREIEKL